VVLGTELVAFSALLTCRHLGIAPVAMIEPNARVTAFAPARVFPPLLGTPLLLGTELVAIHGERQVEGVTLRGPGGAARQLETDGVIVTGQFLPEASLLAASHLELDRGSGGPVVDQFGRCSDPAFFAAGNLLRAVETAGWSWDEGRAAGRAIAASLAGRLPEAARLVPVSLAGDVLKYAVPQRVAADAQGGATRFQLRVKRAARGDLRLSVDGRPVWSRRLSALPEQRIFAPLAAVPAGANTASFELVSA
jgi:hypothetical protein